MTDSEFQPTNRPQIKVTLAVGDSRDPREFTITPPQDMTAVLANSLNQITNIPTALELVWPNSIDEPNTPTKNPEIPFDLIGKTSVDTDANSAQTILQEVKDKLSSLLASEKLSYESVGTDIEAVIGQVFRHLEENKCDTLEQAVDAWIKDESFNSESVDYSWKARVEDIFAKFHTDNTEHISASKDQVLFILHTIIGWSIVEQLFSDSEDDDKVRVVDQRDILLKVMLKNRVTPLFIYIPIDNILRSKHGFI